MFVLMGRLIKKGNFFARSTFRKPPGKEQMLLSPLFLPWGEKGRTFSSLKSQSAGCRDGMSLKEGSKFPPVCFSHIPIIGVAGNLG